MEAIKLKLKLNEVPTSLKRKSHFEILSDLKIYLNWPVMIKSIYHHVRFLRRRHGQYIYQYKKAISDYFYCTTFSVTKDTVDSTKL